MIKVLFLLTVFSFIIICHCQTIQWQSGGPYTTASYQGSTADSSGNLFVGLEQGGIFRSTDKGQSWSSNYYMAGLALGMTTDKFGNVFVCDWSNGILRTTNGGNSWTLQNDGLPAGSTPLAYADLGDSAFIIGTYPPGIFCTTNHGNNWTPMPGMTGEFGRIRAIKELPTGDLLLGSLDSGMFRSTNKGSSWNKIRSYPVSNNSMIYDIKVLHTGRILVATETQGIYKSDDNGIHWSILFAYQNNYFESIGITGVDTIYALSPIYGIFRSINNGDSWANLGPYNKSTRSMVCYPNGDVFIFAPGQGPLVWRAGSDHWDFMHIPAFVAYPLASQGNNIYVSDYSGGFFQTSNGGQTWNRSSVLPVFEIKSNDKGDLFVAVEGGRVWKSTDNGNSWFQVLNATIDRPDGFCLTITASGNIFAGIGAGYYASYGGGIFKSTDDGKTWQETNQGLGAGSILSLLTTDKNTILAANNFNGICRSTDEGSTWQLSSIGLPTPSNFKSETLVQDKEGRIFCGTMYNGVYVSKDDGFTWKPSNTGISTERVRKIVVAGEGKLFAATYNGVFSSSDNGANWHQNNNGIPNPIITGIAIDSTGFLYAGTYGSGVYKSTQSVTGIKELKLPLPLSFQINSYPNPFNPGTTIEYSIPHTGFVSVIIYNSIGEKISTLVSEELQAGKYKNYFNGRELASGIYFCRMETNGFAKTIKLMYLK
jgi:photosystem II stability/assembly factor-like uncharacterized protein